MTIEKTKAGWAHIKRTYGLTEEQFHELDKGYCPLCLRSWSDQVRPVVDHDHVSKFIRGLLCTYCNQRVLGRLRDADLANRIFNYLEKQPLKNKIPLKRRKKRKKRV